MTRHDVCVEMPATVSDPGAVSSFRQLEGSLVVVHSLIHKLELELTDLGIPVAPLYLASARGSLRHVSACIVQHAMHVPEQLHDEIVVGSGIVLRPSGDRAGVGARARVSGQGTTDDHGAEMRARPIRPDLGADLLKSVEASSLCGGLVGATLMFAALAHHRWLHLPTRTKWSTDVCGARALVGALTGGAGFDMPMTGTAAHLVDALVLDMLARLGWVRMLTPAMPRSTAD